MKVSAALPTGVAGLFFDSARRRRELERRLVERLEAAEYSEVILPVVDYLDPYQELLSEGSRQELYRFVDRDGEVLALRADFTPMLARLIAPRLATLPRPLKLFYRGDVLRYREERAGRPRELYQLGAEVLGAAGAEGEREGLRRFLELLATAGRESTVILGFAGALDRPILDHRDASPLAVMRALVRRERAVARRGGTALFEIVEQGVPRDPAALGDVAAARLTRLVALRDELAATLPATLRLEIDLAEFADHPRDPRLREHLGVRAYYDGLIFRAFDVARALPVGGGGRYDELFRKLAAETTAVGFSLSVDLLTESGEGSGG